MGTPLGDFLRSLRDATAPEDVGLTAAARRRAPGLRRSELAGLAGISVEYLTRIEQGRDRNPSPAVVNALAAALHLDATQREHLRHLAKIAGGVCRGPLAQPRREVRPTVRAVLGQLEPGIAIVTNRLGDILACTTGFEQLAGPVGLLDDHAPNLTRFVFTDPRARAAFPDWDLVADERAVNLLLGPSRERSAEFIAALSPLAGPEFARRLAQHDLPPAGPQRWRHPDAGELRLDREVLELPAADAQQLVVFLAADPATAAALSRLRHSARPVLRAVN
ncbi:MAG TPA: helix-turn-helix domain-containing protein [Trebonia sp.]|jgi:transcriptional regulator with XRE-family HTH domain|nr:helix-turn-helix domain-containing protein [Trebonia sp.]